MEAHLLDPRLLQAGLNFYAFSSKWLCHLVDPENKGYVCVHVVLVSCVSMTKRT
jgi:hypothetical protein